MFGFRPTLADQNSLTAVVTDATGITLARVQRAAGSPPTVVDWEFAPVENTALLGKRLKQMAKARRLGRARCATLLHPTAYRILLTEAPQVPAQERVQALRWVIKDMIDTPVQELNLQVFDFPDSGNEKEKQIYVVAAQQDKVLSCVEMLRGSAINIEVLDIMEMAQRNLAELLPENTRGTAMVTFFDDVCVITLSKSGTLYMTRRVEIDAQTWQERPESIYERIALEIQRSLDYYNRHFRQAPIEQVYVTPAAMNVSGLLDYLARFFPKAPQLLNLLEILAWSTPPPPHLHAQLAIAIGAALRQDTNEYADAPAN